MAVRTCLTCGTPAAAGVEQCELCHSFVPGGLLEHAPGGRVVGLPGVVGPPMQWHPVTPTDPRARRRLGIALGVAGGASLLSSFLTYWGPAWTPFAALGVGVVALLVTLTPAYRRRDDSR